MSCIFCSIWLVCTPAVLDYLPSSVSLKFCLASSVEIPGLWQLFQKCLYQSVIFSFGDPLIHWCIATAVPDRMLFPITVQSAAYILT